MESPQTATTTVAVAFDPKSPATIAIPRLEEDKVGGGRGDGTSQLSGLIFSVDRANAGRGIGCNKFENAALKSMLDARDEYLSTTGQNTISVGGEDGETNYNSIDLVAIRSLSLDYRLA